jgi:hypothetical protein
MSARVLASIGKKELPHLLRIHVLTGSLHQADLLRLAMQAAVLQALSVARMHPSKQQSGSFVRPKGRILKGVDANIARLYQSPKSGV